MKKLIDIPQEYERDLKLLAADANTSVKGWMQDLIVYRIRLEKTGKKLQSIGKKYEGRK